MGIRNILELSLAALVVGTWPLRSFAQECLIGPEDPYNSITIENQSELTPLLESCTTLTGQIHLGTNFTGTFKLPGITSINGSLWTPHYGLEYVGHEDALPVIASIEAPDLLYIERMRIGRVIKASFPKLKSLGSIETNPFNTSGVLDLASLETVDSVDLRAHYSSIHLDSLRNITSSFYMLVEQSDSQSDNLLALSFPSLESAVEISITAPLASLSAPKLTSINSTSDDEYDYSGLFVNLSGPPAPIEFPKLTYVHNTMKLAGNLKSISMPALHDVQFSLEIDSTNPQLNFTLPIQSVDTVLLNGNISRAEFPNLSNYTSVYLEYGATLADCDSLEQSLPEYHRICSPPPKEHHRLPGETIGFVIVLPIIFFLIVAGIICWRWRVKRRRRKSSRMELAVRQLESRESDPVPPYAP